MSGNSGTARPDGTSRAETSRSLSSWSPGGQRRRSASKTVPGRGCTSADFLRLRLGLTGTHVGCEQGVCGMCTVIVDGEAVKACLMLAPPADGRPVRTVEGPGRGRRASTRCRSCLSAHHALQCGFCTPGFLMTATALAYQGGCPGRDRDRRRDCGVLCRCTGYAPIVAAIEDYFSTRDLPEGRSALRLLTVKSEPLGRRRRADTPTLGVIGTSARRKEDHDFCAATASSPTMSSRRGRSTWRWAGALTARADRRDRRIRQPASFLVCCRS